MNEDFKDDKQNIKNISKEEKVTKMLKSYINYEISLDGQLTMTPKTNFSYQDPIPILKLSPWQHRGQDSSLYDDQELKAMIQHLNRALQDSRMALSPALCHSISPLHPSTGCLGCVFNKNAKGPRQVTNSLSGGNTFDLKSDSWSTMTTYIILKLYKKLRGRC
ncbi:hypothetical protein FRX31_007790 [Thalictrum thalictroides]|uniref:Uncharacterized protein n=1 Tax=Thalictrum thalictroides TaxID=46969 RepID=A0A7J6WZX1_THATH|nr:hypothetical protein FRX31_007790 [Thalictrum thalictroides]